jgi:predicted small lipoprotein YifL
MRTVLVLLLSVSALSACGLQGDLVRPMPLWGDPPLDGADDPRVIAAAEAAAKAEEERRDAERRAADEARRKELEAQTAPAVTPPAPTPQ